MPLSSKVQQMKKARLNYVLNMIKSLEEIEYVKLMGLLALNQGFSRELTRDYIRELRDCGLIKVEDGIIKISEELKKQKELEKQKAEQELKDREKIE